MRLRPQSPCYLAHWHIHAWLPSSGSHDHRICTAGIEVDLKNCGIHSLKALDVNIFSILETYVVIVNDRDVKRPLLLAAHLCGNGKCTSNKFFLAEHESPSLQMMLEHA